MTRKELERIRRQYKSVKVLVAMEIFLHLLPGFISLFLPDPYDVWGILWLMIGSIPVFIVYNVLAFLFGLDRVFPLSGGGGRDSYYGPCNDPNNMYYDPGCPESPYYEET